MAGQQGIEVKEPSKTSENQLRQLARQLRKQSIHWLREPRWNQISHDLFCVDSRRKLEKDVSQTQNFTLEEWLEESYFRRDVDVIEYNLNGKNGKKVKKKKGVIPDGCAVIANEARIVHGKPGRVRFLVEIDGTTHSNPRFGREKVLAGNAYIKSQEYKARFGVNSGRWLVLTGGEVRMRNLMRQTKQVADENDTKYFTFTTAENYFNADNVLLDAIWWQVDKEKPVALLR